MWIPVRTQWSGYSCFVDLQARSRTWLCCRFSGMFFLRRVDCRDHFAIVTLFMSFIMLVSFIQPFHTDNRSLRYQNGRGSFCRRSLLFSNLLLYFLSSQVTGRDSSSASHYHPVIRCSTLAPKEGTSRWSSQQPKFESHTMYFGTDSIHSASETFLLLSTLSPWFICCFLVISSTD